MSLNTNTANTDRKVARYAYNVSYTIFAFSLFVLIFFAFTNVHHVIIASSSTFVAFGLLTILLRRHLKDVEGL